MMQSILRKQRLIILALLIVIITTIVVGMGLGSASLSYDRLLPTLMGQGTFKEEFVLYSLRLPRIVITLLAGMALALSGAILQGITRNDLAEPGILGINSGAGVAVAIFFYTFNRRRFISLLTTCRWIYWGISDSCSNLRVFI